MQEERLVQIAQELNINLENADCPAMRAIIKEGHKLVLAHSPGGVRDAAIIGSAQRVEHYEMAVYGTLIAFAKELKLDEAEKLLKETLGEEEKADKKLTGIASGGLFSKGVNEKAKNHRKSA